MGVLSENLRRHREKMQTLHTLQRLDTSPYVTGLPSSNTYFPSLYIQYIIHLEIILFVCLIIFIKKQFFSVKSFSFVAFVSALQNDWRVKIGILSSTVF